MKLPETEELEIAPEPDELAQPTEQQGGAVEPDAQHVLLDTFLNRLFRVGELIPRKKCWMQVVGIRGGIVALALKSVPQPPPAKKEHGVRPSRKKKRHHREFTQWDKQGRIKPFVKNSKRLIRDIKKARKAEEEAVKIEKQGSEE